MDTPVYADSLKDFLGAKFEFGFPLQYLKGGIAIWDALGTCVLMNDYIRNILGISLRLPEGVAENLAELISLDLLGTPEQTTHMHETRQGWNLKKTYITDSGVIYLEIVVRPILRNSDKQLLGYLSVFQDVTTYHEPLIFQQKLHQLLQSSVKSDSIKDTTRQIYDCIEMLGFRDMTAVLFDEKNHKLEVLARVVRGKDETQPRTWFVDEPVHSDNRLVKLTQYFLKNHKISTHIQNEVDDAGWEWIKHPYACLPIIHNTQLIGFLVLGQSHSYALTQELVDCSGRTSRFLAELAPVFNRLFVEPRYVEVSRKWSYMKDKLETMNLNQKQIQILEMIVKGETNKGIANVVNLSEQGVKYHVGNLLEIFSTRNRTELRTKLHELLAVS